MIRIFQNNGHKIWDKQTRTFYHINQGNKKFRSSLYNKNYFGGADVNSDQTESKEIHNILRTQFSLVKSQDHHHHSTQIIP